MQVGLSLLTIALKLLLLLLTLTTTTPTANAVAGNPTRPKLHSDAAALLYFQAKSDLNSTLGYSSKTAAHFCKWRGVECVGGRVIRFVIDNLHLGGSFAAHSLTNLDQLRVLSLRNNSLTGSIPNLSSLINLKALFLDHNRFAGSFPTTLSNLHHIRTIDLSYNDLEGEIPTWLTGLDRLYSLRLDGNSFNGSIPPLNQTGLQIFNVSGNNLSGPIPLTPTLLEFGEGSFSGNPNLCGEIIKKECHPGAPFFKPTLPDSDSSPPPVGSLGQNAQVHGVEMISPARSNHKRAAFEIGFVIGLVVLVGLIVLFAVSLRRRVRNNWSKPLMPEIAADSAVVENAAALIKIEEENELEEKVKKVQGMKAGKSGNFVFCAGEAHLYTVDQLMTASAEMLGRGTMGTTYKAVLENRLIMTVKRLDASKIVATNKEMLERQLESVGGLRHPNLVPLRAYLLGQDEKLLIYDYQPNGSLFSLIHGSKSTRAKPLHWTSCLKLAEDVAQGLSYIHQAWRLVHGNVKSSNVLLGSDFEARLTDYALVVLLAAPATVTEEDSNSIGYKAPEVRKTSQQPTSKSDVYSFGVLLLELLTGKLPSKHPYLMPNELLNWVRSTREENGGEDDKSLVMLVEVAIACSIASPEQRPTMWQVLKMIQEIEESVFVEEKESDPLNGLI